MIRRHDEVSTQKRPVDVVLSKAFGANYKRFRQVFPYGTFNEMQSIVADTLLSSDENSIVSSPTGSGKTVCFELAIVKLLMSPSRETQKVKPKIVYLGPSKSLVQERAAQWKAAFKVLGYTVTELSSDSTDTEGENYLSMAGKADIICSTPEKLDSMTRKYLSPEKRQRNNANLINSIGLLLVDEIHLLSENRGATLESVIARLSMLKRQLHAYPVHNLRIIGLSATFPNIDDVGNWLNCPAGHVFVFGNAYRPVPLQIRFNQIREWKESPKYNEYLFDRQLLNNYLFSTIQGNYQNRPCLVFCGTRATTVLAAKKLEQESGSYFITGGEHQRALHELAAGLQDRDLKRVVLKGVAFHNAGLCIGDRRRIENAFLDGIIGALTATTTLAIGVNLPAHLVVILNAKVYRSTNGFEFYQRNTLLQMLGRAGRPGFDTEGVAVILCGDSGYDEFCDIEDGAGVVESQMQFALEEAVNTETVLANITDIGSTVTWLQNTYFSIRAKQRPEYYSVLPFRPSDTGSSNENAHFENELRKKALKTLKALESMSMLTFLSDGMSFVPTHLAVVASKRYLRIDTAGKIGKLAKTGLASVRDILMSIAACDEFSSLAIRQGEKKILNKIYQESARYKAKRKSDRVKTTQLKLFLLFETVFGHIDLKTGDVRTRRLMEDRQKLVKQSQRIVEAMIDYFRHKSIRSPLYANAIVVKKMLKTSLWGDYRDYPKQHFHLLTQVDRVGHKTALKFDQAGYGTFRTVLAADVDTIVGNIGGKVGPNLVNAVQEEARKMISVRTFTIAQPLPLHPTKARLNVSVDVENVTPGTLKLFVVSSHPTKGLLFERKIEKSGVSEFTVGIGLEDIVSDKNVHRAGTVAISLVHKKFIGEDRHAQFKVKFTGHKILLSPENGKTMVKKKRKSKGSMAACSKKKTKSANQTTPSKSQNTADAAARNGVQLPDEEDMFGGDSVFDAALVSLDLSRVERRERQAMKRVLPNVQLMVTSNAKCPTTFTKQAMSVQRRPPAAGHSRITPPSASAPKPVRHNSANAQSTSKTFPGHRRSGVANERRREMSGDYYGTPVFEHPAPPKDMYQNEANYAPQSGPGHIQQSARRINFDTAFG